MANNFIKWVWKYLTSNKLECYAAKAIKNSNTGDRKRPNKKNRNHLKTCADFFFSVLLASIDWCKGDMLVCVPKHMEISVLFVNACGCWSDMSGSGDGYRYRHLKTYFGPHFIRMRAINLVSPWNCFSISTKVVYLSPVEEIHRMILSCDTITSFSFNLFLDLSLSPFVSSP